jgi:hypothetical protein
MNRFARALTLALTFSLGAVIALAGILRGLEIGELAISTGVSMVIFYLLARILIGMITHTVVGLLASEKVEQERRRLLGR